MNGSTAAIQKMEYYLVLKRKELSSHEKTWRKLKCILLTLSESSHSEKAGMNRWSTEDSGGSRTILYVTVTVDSCHMFVKTHRMCNKSGP